jgi:phosphoribosylglycinamide formyltransferase 1
MNIIVLISGNGSNLQAIIDYFRLSTRVTICAVISNRPGAHGLDRAKNEQIPTHCLDHANFSSRQAFDQSVIKKIDHYPVDLIVLAGFMRKLTPGFIHHYQGKIINIHPSLLPKYKGLNTHIKALKNGDSSHGATIHFVTESLDDGPIISQNSFIVEKNTTLEQLKQQTLEIEHWSYPKVIDLIANNYIELVGDHVHYQGKPLPKMGILLKK